MSPARSRPVLLAIVALAVAPVVHAQTTDMDFGSVVLSVSEAPTAQVFHIVDQLSEWDQFTHKQYGRWASTLGLDQTDRRLLQQHAELRRARGPGKGFEQAFLVDDSIERAAINAAANGLLSSTEASAERAILDHFAPKLAALIQPQRDRLGAFRQQLLGDRARLTPLFQKLSRFGEARGTIRVPVFLVANPEENNGGGKANGGRIVVEVPYSGAMSFLLHEALHVILAHQAESIRAAAVSVGLSMQSLNEGIAYAFAPGLTEDTGQVDVLAEELSRHLIRGTPASDAYAQFHMIAAVIRPLLRTALDQGETIGAFLPKAVARWRSVSPR